MSLKMYLYKMFEYLNDLIFLEKGKYDRVLYFPCKLDFKTFKHIENSKIFQYNKNTNICKKKNR